MYSSKRSILFYTLLAFALGLTLGLVLGAIKCKFPLTFFKKNEQFFSGMYVCKSRVLIEYLGSFLFVERQFKDDIMFILPGGKVEPFDEHQSEVIHQTDHDQEHPTSDILLNATRREIYEELGINLPNTIDYLCSHFYINAKNEQVIDVVFHAKLTKRPDIVVDGEEVKSFIWMNPKEILDSQKIHNWLKKWIHT